MIARYNVFLLFCLSIIFVGFGHAQQRGHSIVTKKIILEPGNLKEPEIEITPIATFPPCGACEFYSQILGGCVTFCDHCTETCDPASNSCISSGHQACYLNGERYACTRDYGGVCPKKICGRDVVCSTCTQSCVEMDFDAVCVPTGMRRCPNDQTRCVPEVVLPGQIDPCLCTNCPSCSNRCDGPNLCQPVNPPKQKCDDGSCQSNCSCSPACACNADCQLVNGTPTCVQIDDGIPCQDGTCVYSGGHCPEWEPDSDGKNNCYNEAGQYTCAFCSEECRKDASTGYFECKSTGRHICPNDPFQCREFLEECPRPAAEVTPSVISELERF